jgi:hypothetical protein
LASLLSLCGEFHIPKDVSRFIYPTRVFNAGCIASLALITASFVCRPKARISTQADVLSDA